MRVLKHPYRGGSFNFVQISKAWFLLRLKAVART